MSSAEGQVTGFVASVTTCGADLHYGNYVDIAGIRYAHLSVLAPSIAVGTTLLQGDGVGTEGATGHVLPCNSPTDQSGIHLHWEFRDGSVPTIDGGSGTSSNSVIGEYSTAGNTLRAYYQSHGGWGSIGWTNNLGAGLNMFANKSWGRVQDFRHDPDFLGGEFNTIHVANWAPNQGYLVDSVFWAAWAGGGAKRAGGVHPIGMATQERGPCPSGSTPACISYQAFHLGFVWMDGFTGRHAVFCPDANGNGSVALGDVLFVLSFVGGSNPLYDINGSGFVLLGDVLETLAEVSTRCKP